MSLLYSAQPRSIFGRWVCSTAAFDLNEDYLQGVATPNPRNRLAMVFADCEHIDYTDRLAAAFAVKGDKLPTCPRCNAANAHFRHYDRPSCRPRCFLLRLFPID